MFCESLRAYAVEGKGVTSDPWLPGKIADDLATVGMSGTHIAIKTDTENAIVDVRKAIAKCRDGTTAFDDARVGDSNSNGKIEKCVRELKGQIRTLRSALSEKISTNLDIDSPIMPWMIRHTAYIVTRCKVQEDGRTAFQRMKGRKTTVPLLPFGETMLFKMPKTNRNLGDLQDRFEKGIWIGTTVRSGEHIVARSDGVFRVGWIMRCAPDQRWPSSMIAEIKGTPKEPSPN